MHSLDVSGGHVDGLGLGLRGCQPLQEGFQGVGALVVANEEATDKIEDYGGVEVEAADRYLVDSYAAEAIRTGLAEAGL